jgi:hypothetical protein
MTVTITRLFDDYATATKAVQALESAGVPHSDISIVASNADNWYADKRTDAAPRATTTAGKVDRDADGVDDRAEGAAKGAGVGAAVGGTAGLLAGLGLLAIPGVGPVVAAGWLIATAAGALAGSATGGVIGALTQAGVSKEDAAVYAEGVRRGGTLVSARVADADKSRLEAVMDRSAVKISERGAAYKKSGWRDFDQSAKPFSADEARREREIYSNARRAG